MQLKIVDKRIQRGGKKEKKVNRVTTRFTKQQMSRNFVLFYVK